MLVKFRRKKPRTFKQFTEIFSRMSVAGLLEIKLKKKKLCIGVI